MADIANLFGKAISEIEHMLNTKTIVGEPITVDGNTESRLIMNPVVHWQRLWVSWI